MSYQTYGPPDDNFNGLGPSPNPPTSTRDVWCDFFGCTLPNRPESCGDHECDKYVMWKEDEEERIEKEYHDDFNGGML